jgi:hypothetical protein
MGTSAPPERKVHNGAQELSISAFSMTLKQTKEYKSSSSLQQPSSMTQNFYPSFVTQLLMDLFKNALFWARLSVPPSSRPNALEFFSLRCLPTEFVLHNSQFVPPESPVSLSLPQTRVFRPRNPISRRSEVERRVHCIQSRALHNRFGRRSAGPCYLSLLQEIP